MLSCATKHTEGLVRTDLVSERVSADIHLCLQPGEQAERRPRGRAACGRRTVGSATGTATCTQKKHTGVFSTSQRCPKQPNGLKNIFNGDESTELQNQL